MRDEGSGPVKSKSSRKGAIPGRRPLASRPCPGPLVWFRNTGLVAAWVGAIFCGWQAGGSRWGSGPAGAPGDLLSVVLRGAGAWVGLTVIWLAGINVCQRIIQRSAVSD
jgi:hypothetical protein